MKFLFGNGVHSNYLAASVVTIGNFDGVHRGHQALLTALQAKAFEATLPSVVILFEPQPSEFFMQKNASARLTTLREKTALIQKFNIDHLIVLRFNKQLAQMTPENFVEQMIFSRLNAKHLFVGNDFRFGLDRQGDVQLLQLMGQRRGCQVSVFPDVLLKNQRVSSTAIRQALARYDFVSAESLLGHPFSLSGRVLKGRGLGRQWGVPTANIHMTRKRSPLSGIFCVKVRRANGALLSGVASLGTRPTIEQDGIEILEVHLFDFNDNLYGERLEVFFLEALREERNFQSIDQLIEQIHLDIDKAKLYFNEKSNK